MTAGGAAGDIGTNDDFGVNQPGLSIAAEIEGKHISRAGDGRMTEVQRGHTPRTNHSDGKGAVRKPLSGADVLRDAGQQRGSAPRASQAMDYGNGDRLPGTVHTAYADDARIAAGAVFSGYSIRAW